jgi:hypothetical protein
VPCSTIPQIQAQGHIFSVTFQIFDHIVYFSYQAKTKDKP